MESESEPLRRRTVPANRIDGGGPQALGNLLNSIHDTDSLKAILPWAQGGGYTDSWVVVIDTRARNEAPLTCRSN